MKRTLGFENRDCRLFLLLFLLTLFSFAYFKAIVHSHNSSNRAALCLAILEDGSLRIDKYHRFSIDLCCRDGHYYCDKAPGASFLALPPIAVGYGICRVLGIDDFSTIDPDIEERPTNKAFIVIMACGSLAVSLVCALAVAMMYRWARLLGADEVVAVLAALLLAFGTQYGIYATVLFGHSLVAAIHVLALFWGTVLLRKETTAPLAWIGVGFLLAYAVWTEYPAAIPSCLIGLFFLVKSFAASRKPAAVLKIAGLLFLGAVPVAVGFFWYNNICFGSPLSIGYHHDSTNFPKMDEGFFGLSLPKLSVLFDSLCSIRVGILWLSPMIALMPFWTVRNIYRKNEPALNLLCLAVAAYYLLLNASYAYHETRHLIPATPFFVVPFFFTWAKEKAVIRRGIGLVLTVTLLFSTFAFLTCWRDLTLFEDPATLAAFPPWQAFKNFWTGASPRNVLFYLGFSPLTSYIPVVLVWSAAAWAIGRELRHDT